MKLALITDPAPLMIWATHFLSSHCWIPESAWWWLTVQLCNMIALPLAYKFL